MPPLIIVGRIVQDEEPLYHRGAEEYAGGSVSHPTKSGNPSRELSAAPALND